MKKAAFYLLAVAVLYACKDNTVELAETVEIDQYSIEQFMDNENAFSNGFSSDKSKVLITSNRSGIYNIYSTPVAGGEMMQITQSDSASVFGISYFPDDDRILFRMDGNGDEIYKIFVKDGEEINRLTPAENVRALFRGWAKDGKSFFYGSNERDARYMDHYEMDISDFSSTIVYQNNDGMQFGGMSDDRKYILLSKPINTNDSNMYLLNNENGTMTKINDNNKW